MYTNKTLQETNTRLMEKLLSLNCTISEIVVELEQLNIQAKKKNYDQLEFDTESYMQALKEARVNNVFLEGLILLIEKNIIDSQESN